jgi:Asp-tRNA(Asn)/Glu-tRNA(Gln) amidotransferase A subunit family amidase
MAEGTASRSVEKSLVEIARGNDWLHAVTHFDAALARARAAAIDEATTIRPLHGMTFVAKDLIDVAGLPTTCGSALFGAAPAPNDAACIRLLEAAGAVVLGKSNMHELAVGSARNPWFGQVVNPLSAERGTGGTSSGSAAAVAAGFCDFALGTDSGGSNRSTAAATGLYGFKPTNGLLSLDGIRPVAQTLDTVGILARTGSVLARTFSVLAGEDSSRPHSSLDGRTFAKPVGLHGPVDTPIREALDLACDAIVRAGGRIVEIEFPEGAALAEAGRTILRYEFFRNYGPAIDAKPDKVGSDILAFLDLARQVSTAHYDAALDLVAECRTAWHARLEMVDAMLSPAAPGLAPRLSDEHTRLGDRWVPYGGAGAEFRMWANTIGIPAVSVPVFRDGGLPASIQLAAGPRADSLLIDLSTALGREIENQRAVTTKKGE